MRGQRQARSKILPLTLALSPLKEWGEGMSLYIGRGPATPQSVILGLVPRTYRAAVRASIEKSEHSSIGHGARGWLDPRTKSEDDTEY